jgi:Zn-finger nucleic acid-binding protein
MTKVFVPHLGINVDVCTEGCGGIFFDNREFKDFDEQNESIDEIIKALAGKDFIKVNQDFPRVCPACGAKMVKNFASVKHEVQIDECYACGGKFLDNGELEKIRAQYATESERSADTMKFIYSKVGIELEEMDEKHREAMAHRSVLKKFFDFLVDENSSNL